MDPRTQYNHHHHQHQHQQQQQYQQQQAKRENANKKRKPKPKPKPQKSDVTIVKELRAKLRAAEGTIATLRREVVQLRRDNQVSE